MYFDVMSKILYMVDTAAHREKVAWLSLLAMAVAFVPYFIWMTIDPPAAAMPDFGTMRLFAGAVVVQVVILVIGHAWLRWRSPDDARAAADERDRAIEFRSRRAAYYVLISGVVLVGCVMPFTSGGWRLINASIAAIVLAEVVHYSLTVWGYRRGWHA